MPLCYRRHLGGSQALQLSHKANNLPYPLHLHPLILHLTLENGSIKLEHSLYGPTSDYQVKEKRSIRVASSYGIASTVKT